VNTFNFFITVATLLFISTFAIAAETEIVGKSEDGQSFQFNIGFPADKLRIADFPLPPNTIEPSVMTGIQVFAEQTENASEISNDLQCVMLSIKDGLLISCATEPKNPLSGVVYKYQGINNDGDGMYSCVVGCSDSTPRTLLEITIPSGC
jgi:hypothetical protein